VRLVVSAELNATLPMIFAVFDFPDVVDPLNTRYGNVSKILKR
jgi:hypothetical protein